MDITNTFKTLQALNNPTHPIQTKFMESNLPNQTNQSIISIQTDQVNTKPNLTFEIELRISMVTTLGLPNQTKPKHTKSNLVKLKFEFLIGLRHSWKQKDLCCAFGNIYIVLSLVNRLMVRPILIRS